MNAQQLRKEVEALYARRIRWELTEEEEQEYYEKDRLLAGIERASRTAHGSE